MIAERGQKYLIDIKQVTPWRNGDISASLRGFYLTDLNWHQRARMTLLWPLKRAFIRPWFKVIARVGATGTDEEFLDPGPTEPDNRHSENIIARHDGEIFFYVNDAVVALPWLTGVFYHGNLGEAEVTIRKKP